MLPYSQFPFIKIKTLISFGAVLGLHCCTGFSLVTRGLLSSCGELLIAVACPVVGTGLAM